MELTAQQQRGCEAARKREQVATCSFLESRGKTWDELWFRFDGFEWVVQLTAPNPLAFCQLSIPLADLLYSCPRCPPCFNAKSMANRRLARLSKVASLGNLRISLKSQLLVGIQ